MWKYNLIYLIMLEKSVEVEKSSTSTEFSEVPSLLKSDLKASSKKVSFYQMLSKLMT